ncbi:TPA: hypothetical protein ACMEVV_000506 [Klebsiella quasipneumoniae subsp. quasipneumoniae]
MLIENNFCDERSKKLDSVHYAGGQISLYACCDAKPDGIESKVRVLSFCVVEENIKKESFIDSHFSSFIEANSYFNFHAKKIKKENKNKAKDNSEVKAPSVQEKDKDRIFITSGLHYGFVGAKPILEVKEEGDSDVIVSSSDESIVTATYADGMLHLSCISSGRADVILTKGDSSSHIEVRVG